MRANTGSLPGAGILQRQMRPRKGARSPMLVPAAVLVLCAPVWGAAGKGQQAEAAKPAAQAAQTPSEAAPPAAAATYVGSGSCQACHEDIFNAFQKNAHRVVETGKKKQWEGKACESCHGPGSAHAESATATDIRNPAKLLPADTDKTCLSCHRNQPTHVGRVQNGHARNQVSCAACHTMHKSQLVRRRPNDINEQCASCHQPVWAQFQRPFKHRLPEGAMACTDCHNPHGSLLAKNMRAVFANEPGCFKCHGDKRGPFVFEHASVRLEGCNACHEPHGSANPRMLNRQEVRFTCLECHFNRPLPVAQQTLGTTPPALHDLRQLRFRNCTLCHVKVHGSNVNRSLMR